MTSTSSLTISTSVSGLLPSTVYMVTVTGLYNESGCTSVNSINGVKTADEKDAGPRKFHTGVCACACVHLCTYVWGVAMGGGR